ncbi:MAG: SiaC family regulatory phosphoprotein, partial [Marinoscillum sp.]|uniref:SiaC family regulatory phosphoprotein n=1 Tax=Marinoscillum sp. TaxID=2024838 RepID=UPI0032FE75D1
NCYFHFSVINASTTKLLFNLFSMLTKETRKGNQITIYWVVEQDDEDLIDVGLDFKNALNLDFRITIK